MNRPYYERTPDSHVLDALGDGGPLAFLRALPDRPQDGLVPAFRHEVHLRRANQVAGTG